MNTTSGQNLIKIFTPRKAYEFYPQAFNKSKLTIGSDIENDIWVPELEDFRYIISNHNNNFLIEQIDENENIIEQINGVNKDHPHITIGTGEIHLIYLTIDINTSTEYFSLIDVKNESLMTSRVGEITIGSVKNGNDFQSRIDRITKKMGKGHVAVNCMNLQLVSSQHALVYFNDFGEFWIEDLGSTNGVYVNEFKLIGENGENARKKLSYGDVIDLFTVRLVFCESYLQIDTLMGTSSISGLDKYSPIRISQEDNSPLLKLPPRRMIPLPDEEIKLPIPPTETKNNRDITRILTYMMRPLIWLLLPVIAGIVDKNTSGGVGVSWTTSVLYTAGPLMMVIQFIRQGNKAKKENERKYGRFREKLGNKVKEIDYKKKEQSEVFSKTHTTAQDNLRRALSVDWRLWERTETDEDFLDAKVGTGINQPNFEVTKPEEESLENKPDDLVEELELAYEAHKDIKNYPITLDMKKNPCIGLVGVYESRTKAVLSMIMQLSIHHSPNDLKISLLYPENQKDDYISVKFLPHLWLENGDGRMIFTGDNRKGECDGQCFEMSGKSEKTCPECYRKLCFDSIFNLVETREKLFLDPDAKGKEFLPKYLFIISDIELIKGENSHDLCRYLLKDYSHLGIYTICMGEQRTDIPASFKSVITTGFDKGNIDNSEGEIQRFHMDLYLKENIERISRALAPIRIENLAVDNDIPSSVSLLELFSAETTEQLGINKRWEKQYYEPVPETPVGKLDQNKLLNLNITRKGIGPHGIVGGTTGSGKSEFLLSVILGMAVQCHPHRFGMVILDYKGGSTAESCKDLPHVRGIVTDLDEDVMTRRALAAIKYELEYRENIFREYSGITGSRIEDLESYMSEVKDGPIVPYLLVIVDELAELKIRETAAMEIMEDIARRGRGAGIYLLLTTQNPQGVINAQIQSNVNYKICFRISKDNSRGIIDSPDAAYISDKTPGRGLLRVGNNELQAFQSAYTGAPYTPDEKKDEKIEIPSVYEVDDEGRRHALYLAKRNGGKGSGKTQLSEVVSSVIYAAKSKKINELGDLWLPVMPTRLFLSSIIDETNYDCKLGWRDDMNADIRVLAGLSDDIRNRTYEPTIFDFSAERSHLAIYGPQYSGKSTLIYTLMYSLALQNSPRALNIYLFDFGNTPNTSIAKLPHVGNVFIGTNFQHLSEGLALLMNEMKERAKLFSGEGVANIDEYNLIKSNNILPNIFVFIDNADAMNELKSKVLSQFEEIFKNGISHGVYMIVTANDRRALPYEFRRYLDSHTCCLWPQDITSYVLPRGFSMTARTPGRGYYKGLEFQVALPAETGEKESLNIRMASLFTEMGKYGKGYEIKKSNIVSESFSKEDLLSQADKKSGTMIPFGYDVTDKEVKYINLKSISQVLVSWMDLNAGRNKIAYTYNVLTGNSEKLSNKKTVIWTRDDSWVSKLRNHNAAEIYLFDDNSQQQLHEFMVELYKNLRDGGNDTIILCDEWGELINISSMDTYTVMRDMFKKEEIVGNALFITGASAKNILVWKQKGCPQIVRAIAGQMTLIADGALKTHEWYPTGSRDENIIDKNYVWCIDNRASSYVRMTDEGN